MENECEWSEVPRAPRVDWMGVDLAEEAAAAPAALRFALGLQSSLVASSAKARPLNWLSVLAPP